MPQHEIALTAGDLQKFARAVAAVTDEAVIRFQQDGLDVFAADPAMVAMVDVEAAADEFFSEYDVEQPVQVGVNIEQLQAVAKSFNSSAYVEMEIDEEHLRLQTASSQFKLRTIDEMERPDLDEPEHVVSFKLATSALQETVDRLALFGDAVDLTAQDGKLEVSADGKQGSGRAEFDGDHEDPEGRLGTTVATDYITRLSKELAKAGDDGEIFLKKDYPVRLATRSDGLRLEYTIAPRIEE